MENIKIMKLKENAIIPTRATEGSAGMDLYACIETPVTIKPGDLVTIPSGISAALPSKEMGLFLFARSGLAVKHGIGLSNGVGVVDSDYRGEICIGLCNLGTSCYTIQPGERIAQMIAMPTLILPICQVSFLDETQRGNGGFGSTGKK